MVFQDNGDLALFRNSDGAQLWDSKTAGDPAAVLVMQKDGNLVMYDGLPTIAANDWITGTGLWSTATSGNANAKVVVQSDGNIAVLSQTGSKLWSTNVIP